MHKTNELSQFERDLLESVRQAKGGEHAQSISQPSTISIPHDVISRTVDGVEPDIRHTWASWHAQAGTSLLVLQKLADGRRWKW